MSKRYRAVAAIVLMSVLVSVSAASAALRTVLIEVATNVV